MPRPFRPAESQSHPCPARPGQSQARAVGRAGLALSRCVALGLAQPLCAWAPSLTKWEPRLWLLSHHGLRDGCLLSPRGPPDPFCTKLDWPAWYLELGFGHHCSALLREGTGAAPGHSARGGGRLSQSLPALGLSSSCSDCPGGTAQAEDPGGSGSDPWAGLLGWAGGLTPPFSPRAPPTRPVSCGMRRMCKFIGALGWGAPTQWGGMWASGLGSMTLLCLSCRVSPCPGQALGQQGATWLAPHPSQGSPWPGVQRVWRSPGQARVDSLGLQEHRQGPGQLAEPQSDLMGSRGRAPGVPCPFLVQHIAQPMSGAAAVWEQVQGRAPGWSGCALIQGQGHVVAGKSLCKGPAVGWPPEARRVRTGETGQERAWCWVLMGQMGLVGTGAFPPREGGVQRAAYHCHRLLPSPLALPVSRPAPGSGVHVASPSRCGQCSDGGVS